MVISQLRDDAPVDGADWLSREKAYLLAEAILKFWRSRGHYTVLVWAERIPGAESWHVRSNLVNGLPPATTRLSG